MHGGCCLPATWKPGDRSRCTCRIDDHWRRQWTCLPLRRRSEAAFVIPSASMPGCCGRHACLLKTTGGGCRLTCRLAVDARRLSPSRRPGCSETNSSHLPPCRVFGAAVVLPAASPLRSLEATVAYLLPRPWMRGGIRETCLRGNNRRPLSSHLRPGCRCRLTRRLPWMHGGYRQTCRLAVDARRLSPYLRLGCRSHLTCCLAVDTRRPSHFLRRSSPETKVVLPAASSCMRGGCRQTCRHYLEFIGGGSRLLAALPWMQGGGRLTCCSTA